ncbi:nicotianamine synthase family protein [Fictibacillus phosphorivorans]|uniref:nicotianamine synthase family protein n=1 Tax=Fictibacillus phosphorivorans TaxID=1221500 RepID=UPI0011A32614|nr:nicotianamine synthase family protein [Fictibacillus phosphorivorans]
MKERFQLLLSLKVTEYEINELSKFAKECDECYELLKVKLDSLHHFMTDPINLHRWQEWGKDKDILSLSEKLREASVQALCEMEKYQSVRTCNHQLNASEYITTLSQTVKHELDELHINENSKVLFIGSGAFPISALTIASEKNAEVHCIDIDEEAVEMGRKVSLITGLQDNVRFSNSVRNDLHFAHNTTHVLIASLVRNKREVLNELKDILQPHTKVILRYGNGLKSIFNYPLEMNLTKDWELQSVKRTDGIYDTMVLAKVNA